MVAQILNTYLEKTGKSLGYIANRTGVDRSLLSKIAKESRDPSLDTGIKILKECKASKEQIIDFVDESNRSQSKSYVEVSETERKAKVSQDIAMRVAKDKDIRDSFLDIADSETKGISVVALEEEYGKQIHCKLKPLIDAGVINEENGKYTALNDFFRFDQLSSACLAESIVEKARSDVELDSFVGDYSVEVCNLPKEGRVAVREFLDKQKQGLADIISKYQTPTRKDSVRVGVTTMFTHLKSFTILGILTSLLMSVNGMAGGISGGGNGGEKMRINAIKPSSTNTVKTSKDTYILGLFTTKKTEAPASLPVSKTKVKATKEFTSFVKLGWW